MILLIIKQKLITKPTKKKMCQTGMKEEKNILKTIIIKEAN